MINVFVYGTLLTGESNHHIVAPYVISTRTGCIKGRMYSAGPYPGVVLDSNGVTIDGEWLTIREEGLPDLDELEGYNGPEGRNEYERVWIRDLEKDLYGWVYVWQESGGLPQVDGGSWRQWRKQSFKNRDA